MMPVAELLRQTPRPIYEPLLDPAFIASLETLDLPPEGPDPWTDDPLWESFDEYFPPEQDFGRWDAGRMPVTIGKRWEPHSVRAYSQFRPVFHAVEKLLGERLFRRQNRKHRPKLRHQLRQTIINYYLAAIADQGVTYYRSPVGYEPGTRQHAIHLTFRRTLRTMNALRESGLTCESQTGKKGRWATTDVLTPLGRDLLFGNLPPTQLASLREKPVLDVIQVRSIRQPGLRRRYYPAPRQVKAVREMRRQIEETNKHNSRYRILLRLRLRELADLSELRLLQLAQNIDDFIPALYRHRAQHPDTEPGLPVLLGTQVPRLDLPQALSCSILSNGPEPQPAPRGLPEPLEWLRGRWADEAEVSIVINPTVYRVFLLEKDDDLRRPDNCLCGRFVGEFQLLPEEWRERLVYQDGDQIIPLHERDVTAMFIGLAYNLEGLPTPQDPYGLDGDYSPEALSILGLTSKDVVKFPALIWLGARSMRQGSHAVREYLEEKCPQLDVGRVREAIRRKHEAISHRFGRNYGISLMRTESDIANEVMRRHVDMGWPGPILCVHDSYLAADRLRLDDQVRSCYREVLGGDFECELH